jgi:hypothetical protein
VHGPLSLHLLGELIVFQQPLYIPFPEIGSYIPQCQFLRLSCAYSVIQITHYEEVGGIVYLKLRRRGVGGGSRRRLKYERRNEGGPIGVSTSNVVVVGSEMTRDKGE